MQRITSGADDTGGLHDGSAAPVRLGAEALGTFLFFFLGFAGIAVVVDIGGDAITPLGVAAGFGFGLALAIAAFGHISGGHFNPAVSIGLAIAGRFPNRDVVEHRKGAPSDDTHPLCWSASLPPASREP